MNCSSTKFFTLHNRADLNAQPHIENQLRLANTIGYAYLIQRIKDIGAIDKDVVVDLACGIGHWSLVLSKQNRLVYAIDSNKPQLVALESMITDQHTINVIPVAGLMQKIPLHSASVDFVLCVAAFMFGSPNLIMAEIFRILKPGGFVFLHVNAFPLWLRRFLRGIMQFDWTGVKAGLMGMGLWPCAPTEVNFSAFPSHRRLIERIVRQLNGTIIHYGADGTTGISSAEKAQGYYANDKQWCGMELRREYLIRKLQTNEK